MSATAFPLYWPRGWKRTKDPTKSRFSTSITGALNNVREELRRFGRDTETEVSGILISSNVTLGEQSPTDGGVAVYFRWDNSDCCIAVDRYRRPEENLQAISLIIVAERAKMRHGGLNIVRAAFRGYLALPPATANGELAAPWWSVLGFKSAETASMTSVDRAYRELVKMNHPDRGGDPAKFAQIADAIREAREALKHDRCPKDIPTQQG